MDRKRSRQPDVAMDRGGSAGDRLHHLVLQIIRAHPLLLLGLALQIPGYALLALAYSTSSLMIAYALLGVGGAYAPASRKALPFQHWHHRNLARPVPCGP